MCRSDFSCDCHLRPCPQCDGTGRDPYDETEACGYCQATDDEPREREFDPHAADRMADRADDARWAVMP